MNSIARSTKRLLTLVAFHSTTNMTITERFTDVRPTDERIAEFESVIQGSLPEDYKRFLKEENGGRPSPDIFRFKTKDGNEEDSVLHYFFALYEGRVGSIERSFGFMKGRIPADYLAIATDSFGNMILLRTALRGLGKVYFWDHEKEDEDADMPTLKNMTAIAASFSEFIGLLEEEP